MEEDSVKKLLAIALLGLTGTQRVHADNYGGIGVEITTDNAKHVVISRVDMSSPAWRAGIMSGEIIGAVDGQSTEGRDVTSVGSMIRGPVGTYVTLTLLNANNENPHSVSVQRGSIEQQCFVDGSIRLHLSGDEQHGNLDGYFGRESVYLQVYSGRVSGWYKNRHIDLDIRKEYGNNFTISGPLGRSYIRWSSYGGGSFNDYAYCIQE